MSRWDSLKHEKGEEKERRNEGPRLNLNKRWTSSNSKTKYDGSRQQINMSYLKGMHQHQRKKNIHLNQFVSSSKTETVNNEKLPILMTEYHALVNSLKSQLLRYQSRGGNKDYDNWVIIENLMSLLDGAVNINQSASHEQPCNTDIFMALLNLLQIAEENENFDGNDNARFLAALTIESCLKLSINGETENALSKITLSKSEVEFGITTLSSHYNSSSVQPPETQSSMDSSLLVAIALLVKNHVCDLAPESTARHVVGAIFIPYLSSLQQNQNHGQGQVYQSRLKTTSLSFRFKIKCVCEATIALLQNPSHASAILAPLVEDVSIQLDYGIEEQIINPLRMKLLWALLRCLETPHDQGNKNVRRIEEQEFVCQTLSASIDAIRKLKKGNGTNNATHNDVDVQIIKPLQKFILEVVTEYNIIMRKTSKMVTSFGGLMVTLLQLLRALVTCFPMDMTGTGWKLIIEGANRNVKSALSHTTGSYDMSSPVTSSYLPLILTIHIDCHIATQQSEVDYRYLALTMDCLADFILVLPWKKWLKQTCLGHDRQQRYKSTRALIVTPTKDITSGLYKTVVDAVVMLIEISKNVFCKCRDKALIKSLGRLIKSLMLEIPYCDIKLICAGVDLWEVVAKVILGPPESINCLFIKEKEIMAYEVLVVSSGGTVNPQGHMHGMSVPAQTWFLSKEPSTELFFRELLNLFESVDGRLDRTVKILSSILRTLPDVALRRWDDFHKIFEELNTNSSKNNNTDSKDLKLLEVLESLMLGRKDFDVSTNLKPKNDRIITDLDGIMLKRWNQNGLQRCVNIYSSFRSQDWIQLDRFDGRVFCHFGQILSHCHNSNAKIREGAARAVGEFCSQYIIRSNSSGKTIKESETQQYRSFTHEVHAAMLELYRDQNAGARSMSIFSLGNLASALKGSNLKDILGTSRLHEMSKAILYSFNDTNDKVVKNAIRSAGHTSNLLALAMRCEGYDEHFSTSRKLLVETIESLTLKLWNTLHVALNEEQKAAMTWKERSAAKKHGWGACHSLGLVFEGLCVRIFEECNDLVSACLKASRCLVLCSCHYTSLNEKVVLAAMSAICHLPSNFMTLIDSQKLALGDALKTSILILESTQDTRIDNGSSKASNNKAITSKLIPQNEIFLCYLLTSASISDANEVLTDDRISTQTLSMLYSWMVEKLRLGGLTARAFEIFAVALQRPGRWSASVGLEQQFTSRALQKFKQERNGKNSLLAENCRNLPQNRNEEDEADEL